MRDKTAQNLDRLACTVEDFCRCLESLPSEATITKDWGPREVLSHLVYWHELYLVQTRRILAGKLIDPPSGRFSDLNAQSVEKFRTASIPALVPRFRSANRRLCTLTCGAKAHTVAFPIKEGSKRWRLTELLPGRGGAHVQPSPQIEESGRHPPCGLPIGFRFPSSRLGCVGSAKTYKKPLRNTRFASNPYARRPKLCNNGHDRQREKSACIFQSNEGRPVRPT